MIISYTLTAPGGQKLDVRLFCYVDTQDYLADQGPAKGILVDYDFESTPCGYTEADLDKMVEAEWSAIEEAALEAYAERQANDQ